MGFIRLVVFGFIGLSVLYFLISVYSRSIRREKLEKRWDAEHADDGNPAERDAFVEKGIREYDKGIRPKLILLVYIIPTILVIVIHVLTTYY